MGGTPSPDYTFFSENEDCMETPLLDKSLDCSINVVKFYEAFSKSGKNLTIANQLLRSATSVGANINESIYAISKADFISKLHISLKEINESLYWLEILIKTNIFEYNYNPLKSQAIEIKKMLISSLKTAKQNINNN